MLRLENIQRSFKSIQEKTKAFFHGEQWKEALVFSCFVLLAFGFWLLKSLQQEYEITLSVPVKYKNIPADIAFDESEVDRIAVRVKDKGSVLLNYTMGHPFAPIEVEMKDTQKKTGHIHISKRRIENDIQKQLLSTTVLERFEPQQIDVKFSQRVLKMVPVVFNGDIEFDAGFLPAGDIQIEPKEVNVYATKEILDTLNSISTVFTAIKNGNKNITKKVQLASVKGVNLDPDNVTITFPIEEYTEKTLEIPVFCDHKPVGYTIRMFPSVVKVVCSVPLSRFKELSKEMFEIQVPFEELEHNITGSFPIKLLRKPDWVQTVTLEPERIEFILEQNYKHD